MCDAMFSLPWKFSSGRAKVKLGSLHMTCCLNYLENFTAVKKNSLMHVDWDHGHFGINLQ